jgi:hypothetical protein
LSVLSTFWMSRVSWGAPFDLSSKCRSELETRFRNVAFSSVAWPLVAKTDLLFCFFVNWDMLRISKRRRKCKANVFADDQLSAICTYPNVQTCFLHFEPKNIWRVLEIFFYIYFSPRIVFIFRILNISYVSY